MKSIDYFLDLAKEKLSIKSDRELSRRLGLTSVNHYRKRNVIPDDMTALKLAELCQLPGHEVMITCHLLKAAQGEHPETHTEWQGILKMVSNGCLVLAALGFANFTPVSVLAVNAPSYMMSSPLERSYYPLCDVAWWRDLCSSLLMKYKGKSKHG